MIVFLEPFFDEHCDKCNNKKHLIQNKTNQACNAMLAYYGFNSSIITHEVQVHENKCP